MPKYLFKGLDAASAPGPGPTLWFQSPTSFNDLSAQVTMVGGNTSELYTANVEITLNGTDFRPIPFPGGGYPIANFPNGAYSRIGPIIQLMMGFRINLVTFTSEVSPTLTVLLAIDQKD